MSRAFFCFLWLACAALPALADDPFPAAAEPRETFRQDVFYRFLWRGPFERDLVFFKAADGGEETIAHYPLDGCGLAGPGTGHFPFLDGIGEAPVVALVCERADNSQTLLIFAPEDDPLRPVFSAESVGPLFVSVASGGIAVTFRNPDEPENFTTRFWEPYPSSFGSNAFRDARDAALGKHFTAEGTLPAGLDPAHYRIAHDPDMPLRLGPAEDAPWFERAGASILVHVPGDERAEAPHWEVDGWLRVCLVEGGCGYVPVDAVTRPAASAR
ncbi:hypothetical protein [Parvibaculum sp.]|uniref:hypothetical protein n=1 Tax=Parvibaculum sp. TaxID=2024848 RepID=UPI001DFFFA04|nr:hypothetical protein [Parvibaculum sp.]MBX3489064.1 hypothetical protein [Parvibaculum sp.]MCW5727067.1 hypothetical protein [Parvibaculum sp.]